MQLFKTLMHTWNGYSTSSQVQTKYIVLLEYQSNNGRSTKIMMRLPIEACIHNSNTKTIENSKQHKVLNYLEYSKPHSLNPRTLCAEQTANDVWILSIVNSTPTTATHKTLATNSRRSTTALPRTSRSLFVPKSNLLEGPSTMCCVPGAKQPTLASSNPPRRDQRCLHYHRQATLWGADSSWNPASLQDP